MKIYITDYGSFFLKKKKKHLGRGVRQLPGTSASRRLAARAPTRRHLERSPDEGQLCGPGAEETAQEICEIVS